jgi:hypothetical protein
MVWPGLDGGRIDVWRVEWLRRFAPPGPSDVMIASPHAETLNTHGSAVAYQIRYEGTKTQDTTLLFLTEGLLLRQARNRDVMTCNTQHSPSYLDSGIDVHPPAPRPRLRRTRR